MWRVKWSYLVYKKFVICVKKVTCTNGRLKLCVEWYQGAWCAQATKLQRFAKVRKLFEQGRKLECKARAHNAQCIWRFDSKFGGLIGNFFTQNLSAKVNPYPLFQWYPQSTESFQISAFNAQGKTRWNLVYHQNWWKNYLETQFMTKR